MSRSIVIFVFVAIILAMGAFAIQSASESPDVATEITDEQFSPSAGINAFNESNQDRTVYPSGEYVTIENESDGFVFEKSGNYSWVQHNGTIDVESGSQLANAGTAFATYRYRQYDRDSWEMRSIMMTVYNWLGMFILPAGFGVFIIAIAKALRGL